MVPPRRLSRPPGHTQVTRTAGSPAARHRQAAGPSSFRPLRQESGERLVILAHPVADEVERAHRIDPPPAAGQLEVQRQELHRVRRGAGTVEPDPSSSPRVPRIRSGLGVKRVVRGGQPSWCRLRWGSRYRAGRTWEAGLAGAGGEYPPTRAACQRCPQAAHGFSWRRSSARSTYWTMASSWACRVAPRMPRRRGACRRYAVPARFAATPGVSPARASPNVPAALSRTSDGTG
jgi:hypothetical protein